MNKIWNFMRTLKKAQLKAAQRYENFLSVLKITPDSLFSYASLTLCLLKPLTKTTLVRTSKYVTAFR